MVHRDHAVNAATKKPDGTIDVAIKDMKKDKDVVIDDCDALLVCIGRRPYLDNLGLDTVGVQLDENGVEIDKSQQGQDGNDWGGDSGAA